MMEILVIGDEMNFQECQAKFGRSHTYQRTDHQSAQKVFKSGMVVLDFEPADVSIYNRNDITVFLNSVYTTLGQSVSGSSESKPNFYGFCGMNSFLNREIFEVTAQENNSQPALEEICLLLNTKYNIVEDRVGMVTPRIICMIINEAFFAIEENVASCTDIDLAMKLGTNYPFGPFEWCNKIGIKNVYRLLKAVYESTNDERYKICKKLEEEALA